MAARFNTSKESTVCRSRTLDIPCMIEAERRPSCKQAVSCDLLSPRIAVSA